MLCFLVEKGRLNLSACTVNQLYVEQTAMRFQVFPSPFRMFLGDPSLYFPVRDKSIQ